MSGKFTVVRHTVDGEHFEILVHPDNALNYKLGRNMELSQVIAIDEVYSDSSKGLRASSDKIQKYFDTSSILKAARIVLEKGELQLTTEQRRKMIEDKRKQVVALIARNFIDPRTGIPHPPNRIEQALQEVKVSIDPYKDAQEQTKLIINQLRTIIPLKSENIKLRIRVPTQYSPQTIGIIKGFGEIVKEEWGSDGSLTVQIEIPAGVHSFLIERLGAVTKGSAQANILR